MMNADALLLSAIATDAAWQGSKTRFLDGQERYADDGTWTCVQPSDSRPGQYRWDVESMRGWADTEEEAWAAVEALVRLLQVTGGGA